MKRTVWDRIDRVDGATAMDSTGWEGEDAPTNVAPPAFARTKPSRGNAGFLKGVLVGVGASAMLAGFTALAGVAIAVAVYGLPALPAAPAAIAHAEDAIAIPVAVVPEPVRPVVVEPPAPVRVEVEPVATPEPVAIPKAEPRPAPGVASRPRPVETKRAAPVAPPPAVAKAVSTPAPVPVLPPEPPRPNREELLQLALAAKKTPAAPAPTPAPAPRWEEPDTKQQDVAAAEEKWVPVDDTEPQSSTPADSGSDDLSTVLGD